jgi:hypothetical protein
MRVRPRGVTNNERVRLHRGSMVHKLLEINSPTCAHNCNRQRLMPVSPIVQRRIERRPLHDVHSWHNWLSAIEPGSDHPKLTTGRYAKYFPLPFCVRCDKSKVDPVPTPRSDTSGTHTAVFYCVCLPVYVSVKESAHQWVRASKKSDA